MKKYGFLKPGPLEITPKGIKKMQDKSEHFRTLQQKSIASRIQRGFDVEFQLLPGAQMPWRKRTTDAGFDLYAYENTKIWAGKITWVRTGAIISCPPGYFFHLTNRSSLLKEGLVACQGVIDAGYTGEIMVALFNTSRDHSIVVNQGDRIAQAIFHPILQPTFLQVEKFTEHAEHRGQSGFGSSGRRDSQQTNNTKKHK